MTKRRMFKNHLMMTIVLIASLFISGQNLSSAEEWPTKPINLICGWGAGGGTDLVDRFLAAEMQKELGKPIAVSNMSGGNAGIAAAKVWQSPSDGYTWWGTGDQIYAQAVMNGHPSTVKDWHTFFGFGAEDLVSVRSDSPYKEFDDLIKAAREKPDQIKVAASGIATHMHIVAIALTKYGKLKLNVIPYAGSNPSQLALLRGEVDVIITTVQEQSDFIKTNKIRPLVVTDTKPYFFEGEKIPSIIDFIPEMKPYVPVPQVLGFGISKKVPTDRVKKIDAAFKKVLASPAAKEFSEKMKLPILGSTGWSLEKAEEMLWPATRFGTWFYYDAGLTKESPEKFGIPKP